MSTELNTADTSAAIRRPSPLFRLGRLFVTPGALAALAEAEQSPEEFLRRHQSGDWGDLCAEDRQENQFSLAHHFRLLSAYRTQAGEKLWLLTEADRSATTILLPREGVVA